MNTSSRSLSWLLHAATLPPLAAHLPFAVLACVGFVLAAPAPASAQPAGPVRVSAPLQVRALQAQRALVTPSEELKQAFRSGASRVELSPLSLPGGETIPVTLEKFDPLAEGATFTVETPTGPEQRPFPKCAYYFGHATDGTNRPVLASFLDETGQVFMQVGGYAAGKQPGYILAPAPASASLHMIHRTDGATTASFRCGTDSLRTSGAEVPDPKQFLASLEGAVPKVVDNGQRRRVEVRIDVDYLSWRDQFASSTAQAGWYATNILAACSLIYERDLNTSLRLADLIVWQTSDPFRRSTISSMLTTYRSYCNTNRPRMNASILLCQETNSLNGGIGYVEGVCNGGTASNYGYSVAAIDASTSVFTGTSYTWDVTVVAHELGHNLGSPHTWCYVPPIDCCTDDSTSGDGGCDPASQCGAVVPQRGTIMSYCHLTNSGIDMNFGSRVSTLLRNYVVQNTCIAIATPTPIPTITPIPTLTPIPTPTATPGPTPTPPVGCFSVPSNDASLGANVSFGQAVFSGTLQKGRLRLPIQFSRADSAVVQPLGVDMNAYIYATANGCPVSADLATTAFAKSPLKRRVLQRERRLVFRLSGISPGSTIAFDLDPENAYPETNEQDNTLFLDF